VFRWNRRLRWPLVTKAVERDRRFTAAKLDVNAPPANRICLRWPGRQSRHKLKGRAFFIRPIEGSAKRHFEFENDATSAVSHFCFCCSRRLVSGGRIPPISVRWNLARNFRYAQSLKGNQKEINRRNMKERPTAANEPSDLNMQMRRWRIKREKKLKREAKGERFNDCRQNRPHNTHNQRGT
jgi:hypothetical protein